MKNFRRTTFFLKAWGYLKLRSTHLRSKALTTLIKNVNKHFRHLKYILVNRDKYVKYGNIKYTLNNEFIYKRLGKIWKITIIKIADNSGWVLAPVINLQYPVEQTRCAGSVLEQSRKRNKLKNLNSHWVNDLSNNTVPTLIQKINVSFYFGWQNINLIL